MLGKEMRVGFWSVFWLAMSVQVGGCADDGHEHASGHGHVLGESGPLQSQVVEAACGEVEAMEAMQVPDADADGGLLVVPTDGTPLRLRAPESGPVLVQFLADVDHGNWRVLAGHEAELVEIRIGDRVQRTGAVLVTDEACTALWRHTLWVHTHGEELYTAELNVPSGAEFWFTVMLESVGH